MIVNLYYDAYAARNVAENYTQPIDYFDFPVTAHKVPFSSGSIPPFDPAVSTIIIGGSGILSNRWRVVRDIVDQTAPTVPIVIWGMGINDHGRFDRNYDEVLGHIEPRENVLIGLRDCFYRNYVPCVSCMRPELDANFVVQHEFGLYVHQAFDISLHYPTMSNRIEGDPRTYLWRVLQFLGSCDTIITNTYHGAYWATLLKRKVVVVEPFSNKFFGFKYEPVILRDIRSLKSMVHLARCYPEALSESRRINREFYSRVIEFRQKFCAAAGFRESVVD